MPVCLAPGCVEAAVDITDAQAELLLTNQVSALEMYSHARVASVDKLGMVIYTSFFRSLFSSSKRCQPPLSDSSFLSYCVEPRRVVIRGTIEDVARFQYRLEECLRSYKETIVPLNEDIIKILKSRKADLYEKKFSITFPCDVYIEFTHTFIKIASFNEESIQRLEQLLTQLEKKTETIFKNTSAIPKEKFQAMKTKTEQLYLVNWTIVGSRVTITIIEKDFNRCMREIKKFFDQYPDHFERINFITENMADYCLLKFGKNSDVQISSNVFFNFVNLQGVKDDVMVMKQNLLQLEKSLTLEKWNLRTEFKLNQLYLLAKKSNYRVLREIMDKYQTFEGHLLHITLNVPTVVYLESHQFGHQNVRHLPIRQEPKYNVVLNLSDNCQLVLKPNGNIAAELSDILVSVMNREKDIRKTAIGRAFCKRSPSFWREVSEVNSTPSDSMLTVENPKDLSCMAVCHAILEPWKETTSPQQLTKAIQDVFTLAKNKGARSVSFPALGCGHKFKFPAIVVAKIFIKTIREEIAKGPFNEVVIVSQDDKVFKELKEETLSLARKLQNNGIIDAFDINIMTPQQGILASLKSKIKKDIEDECLCTNVFSQDKFKIWPTKSLKRINELSVHLTVLIQKLKNLHTKCLEFHLTGGKRNVIFLMSFIELELLKEAQHLPKRSLTSQQAPERGSVEFLKYAFESDEHFPSYWSSNDTQIHHNSDLVMVDRRIKKDISKLLISTFRPEDVGLGRDASNLSHSAIKVIDVKRVENLELFSKYSEQRKDLFKRMAIKGQLCPDIGSLPESRGKVKTTEFLSDEMKKELYHEINEHYLFHGTKEECIKDIIHTGLNPNKANPAAMFGKGVYAAEEFSKSDQYSDERLSREPMDRPLKIILLRVLLGNPFVCSQRPSIDQKLLRPPCANCKSDNCHCLHQEYCDSVLADGDLLFREFVTYKADLCYPEYVITYKRKFMEPRHHGSGEEY